MSNKSTIHFDIELDQDKVPENINWQASDSPLQGAQDAKAIAISIWDGKAKESLKMDLWTKEMTVEEMNHFVFQSMSLLLGTFKRATNNNEAAEKLKTAIAEFGKEISVLK